MDSLLTSAAGLLAAGDPLGALKRIALRDEPPALALRGIAMAQLGDYRRARDLLRRAARSFGTRERVARARCVVAEAEVALASRDLKQAKHGLESAARILAAHDDHANALHARLLAVRFHLLVGEIDEAERIMTTIDLRHSQSPPQLVARTALTRAELALRRMRIAEASTAVERAGAAARSAGIAALAAEVERVRHTLTAPAARLIQGGVARTLRLHEVAAVYASDNLIVDGGRREVRGASGVIRLAGRPVLFGAVRALAESWPQDVSRDELVMQTFATRTVDESHRVRLRVEMSRLRAALRPLARIKSTARGFRIVPIDAPAVVVLAPPIDGPAGAILALLKDGEAWSTSSLSRALNSSQRTVQRTLRDLEQTAAVRAIGQGRSRRWLAPALSEFATTLLLPGSLPLG